MRGHPEDLTGKTFGRLMVIKRADPPRKFNSAMWECQCECGNTKMYSGSSLMQQQTRSCGCLKKELTKDLKYTHGQRYTRLHCIWGNMKQRTLNPNNKSAKNYNLRGISICEDWKVFEMFYDWANKNGYEEHLTIERIDNDGNYEPGNCRWATKLEQSRNTRKSIVYTYKNETRCLSEFCDMLGLNYHTIYSRIEKGWELEKAFETPIRKLRR